MDVSYCHIRKETPLPAAAVEAAPAGFAKEMPRFEAGGLSDPIVKTVPVEHMLYAHMRAPGEIYSRPDNEVIPPADRTQTIPAMGFSGKFYYRK